MRSFTTIEIVRAAFAGVYLVTWLAGVIPSFMLTYRLKRHHPGVWARIKQPPDKPIRHSWNYTRWVWQRQYIELEDARLTALGEWTNRALKLFLVVAGVYLITSFTGVWS